MLKALKIQNYALIEVLEVEFHQGLNVITGETGAGKSIILGALGLILGKRFDSTSLIDKEQKVVVEGMFSLEKNKFLQFFGDHDLDFDEQTIIRREILPSGKSRAFINDTPVVLNILTAFSEQLIDIHAQHQNTRLKLPSFQLALLDSYARNSSQLTDFRHEYHKYNQVSKELKELEEKEKQAKKDFDYYQFLLDELEKASLAEDEQQALEKELDILENAEEIKSSLFQTGQLLSDENTGVLESLRQIERELSRISGFDPEYEKMQERMSSVLIELSDLGKSIESHSEQVEVNEQEAENIRERLNLINQLLTKHQLQHLNELLQLQEELRKKINGIDFIEENIQGLQKEKEDTFNKLFKLGEQISKSRKAVIPIVEKELQQLLRQLGMKDARIIFRHVIAGEEGMNINGIDQVEMLFSSNKGIQPDQVSKIASGGELSRLMLAIKHSLAASVLLPTIIFDEIDLGISGEIAIKVGNMLKKIAQKHQVISITHLPQIASMGDHHFHVYKEVFKQKSLTKMREIKADERVLEIAKMIGGDQAGKTAISNAKELLSNFA